MTEEETIEIETTPIQGATALATLPGSASFVNLRDFGQVWKFAQMVANTELVPQHFQKKPQAIVVAIQWGIEIGIPPMQALQNIAVINGRPSIWGDLGKAIVQAHPELVGYSETYDPVLKLAQVTIKRRRANGAEIETTGDFSWQDAVDAKLSTKNTYQAYARDMLMWRAFWRAARATFADALRGLGGAEESRDLERVKSAKVTSVSDAAAELTDALGTREEPPAPKPHEQVQAEERQHGKTTPPDAAPNGPRDKRVKDDLVKKCETHLDMLGILDADPRMAAARELVTVPDKAKTLKGLPVDTLHDLEIALTREIGGE